MTTAGNFHSVTSRGDHQVDIAGVPWPTYKLIALAVGALVLVVVGVATMNAAPAVLSAARGRHRGVAGAGPGLALRSVILQQSP